MKPNNFNDAQREQTSILAPLERRVLHAIVRRMPAAVNSDHLSILGLLGMLFAGVCYAASRQNSAWLYAVNFCIFLNWFGDSLDGTLARYRNRLRPRYGFYVDHIVDAFGIFFLIAGFGLSGYMSLSVAMAFLIAYYLLNIEIYLATYTVGVFKLSYGIWGPTELRVLLAIGNIAMMFKPHVTVAGHRFLLADVGAAVGIPVILAVAIIGAVRNTARLYEEERLN